MFFLISPRRQRGAALLVAIIALTVLASLGLAMYSSSTAELSRADTQRKMSTAHFVAESGLNFVRSEALPTLRFSTDVSADTILTELVTALTKTDNYGNYTNNLAKNLLAQYGTVSITNSGGVVTVPSLNMTNGSYSLRFVPGADSDGNVVLTMYVTGTSNGTSRTVMQTFETDDYIPAVFDYGIASKGRVDVGGHASVTGTPSEAASLLSTADTFDAISIGGSSIIDGELYVTAERADAISISGSAQVAGSTNDSKILSDYSHFGTPDPEFPEIDVTCFTDLVTTTISSPGDLDDPANYTEEVIDGQTYRVYENIELATSAQQYKFSSDTIIRGVLVIDHPNDVIFSSKVGVYGAIVSDNTYTDGESLGSLKFTGQVNVNTAESLPDLPKWEDIRSMSSTSILAPGFDVTFTGSSFSANGVIAAEVIKWTGNNDISGSLPGPILGLGEYAVQVGDEIVEDDDMTSTLTGSVTINLVNIDETEVPAGFVGYQWLVPIPETQTDVIPDW